MKRSSKAIQYSEQTEDLSTFAKALAHPARIVILKHLSKQEACLTGELTGVLPLAQSTISQHLKELKDAGLIDGEVAPPRIRYCINQKNWQRAKKQFEILFQEDFRQISCC